MVLVVVWYGMVYDTGAPLSLRRRVRSVLVDFDSRIFRSRVSRPISRYIELCVETIANPSYF